MTKFLQLLAFLVLLGVPLTQHWVPLEILKLRIFDTLVEEKEVSNYFSILSIDEKDVQKENGYPFPRKRLAQIQNKLIEKGFDREDILLSINEFAAKNIQSDSRFTEEFIRSRLKKNKGPNLISSELNCRGITEALISENLSKISHDQWLDSAFAALRKKLKGSSITLEDRDKIYSFLIGRGFEHKMIKYALNECKNEC